jgi:hypothetical protein
MTLPCKAQIKLRPAGVRKFFDLLDEEDLVVMMRPGETDLLQLFRLGFADRREIRDLLHVHT